MPKTQNGLPISWNLDDLLNHLGGVPPSRVRLNPAPGTATESDLIAINRREDRLFELVDAVLVEKAMGAKESFLAMWLGHLLMQFLEEHDLGIVLGADGALRLMPGLVRIPDISFIRWQALPGRNIPDDPVPNLAPDLAVEVLSKSNTTKEMKRKLKEYFDAGTKLVWFVDGKKQTIEVFASPSDSTLLDAKDTLTGGDLLPGFTLPLSKLFERLNGNRP